MLFTEECEMDTAKNGDYPLQKPREECQVGPSSHCHMTQRLMKIDMQEWAPCTLDLWMRHFFL